MLKRKDMSAGCGSALGLRGVWSGRIDNRQTSEREEMLSVTVGVSECVYVCVCGGVRKESWVRSVV